MAGNQNRLNSGVILRWTLLTVSGLLLAMLVFLEPLYGPVSSPIALAAPDGKAIFQQKCQGCHTIGGGKTVGPDLKGTSGKRGKDCLVRFISIPDRLIAQGDPIARDIVKEFGMPMPNLGVTAEEAQAIMIYIDSLSIETKPAPTAISTPGSSPPAVTPSSPAVTPGAVTTPATNVLPTSGNPDSTPTASSSATPAGGTIPASALPATGNQPQARTTSPADASTGKDLFMGRTSLKNNGPACLACHNVSGIGLIGGGTVGKDLTGSYALMGEPGLTSILKTPPFPIMKEIISAKPLTDSEIANLVAFMKEAGSTPATSSQNSALFFILTAAGAIFVFVIFQFLWRRRLSNVRRSMLKGGSK